MPNVSIKATIAQKRVAAGDTLSGSLWINPRSSRGPTSSIPRVKAIRIAAKAIVKVQWEDMAKEIERTGQVQIYRVEKELLTEPLEINGPKILDFKIALPVVVQRTATSWNQSPQFECSAGHQIPPSLPGVVDHVLEIEVKTDGGFFRNPRHISELCYCFVAPRKRQNPDPWMQLHSRAIERREKSPRLLPNTLRRLSSRSNVAASPSAPTSPVTPIQVAATLSPGIAPASLTILAQLPRTLFLGGPLPIELSVTREGNRSPESSLPDVLLTSLSIDIQLVFHQRIKLAENTGAIDPEAFSEIKERHRLKHVKNLAVKITERTRVDQQLDYLQVLAPAGVPSFKTYNAARNYILEVWMTVSVDNTMHNLEFTQHVVIESGYFRVPAPARPPPAAPRSNSEPSQNPQGELTEEEADDMYLPPYSDPPPSYGASVDNQLSLETQARTQGVDIIDLL